MRVLRGRCTWLESRPTPPCFFHSSNHGGDILEYPGCTSKKADFLFTESLLTVCENRRSLKKMNLIRLLNIIAPVIAVKYKMKT